MSGEAAAGSDRSRPAAAAAAPLALVARGIERRFGRFAALRGVDLDLAPGRSLALFGPNGAGKTTLLRILALVLRPSAGSLEVLGIDPRRDLEAALAGLGFLGHEVALYLDLTPEENLVFTARLHALPDPRAQAREALAAVGLAGRDVPVRALSRGLMQRVALARALLHRPRLMLLDEPWTGLDPQAQRLLRERIARQRDEGGATLFTTHDLRQGWESADRVVVLARGRVVFAAGRDELPFAELERAYAAAVDEAW